MHPAADLTTDVGEQRLVTLQDGTHVFLNTATRIAVNFDAHARRVELKSGEALFDVAKKPTWPFIVKAGDRQIKALGTSFVVRRDATQTSVTLVEGTVSVITDGSGSAIRNSRWERTRRAAGLHAEARTKLTFLGEQAATGSDALDKAVAWRRGEIIFDDTSLSDAGGELNRYNKDMLVVEQPGTSGAGDWTFSNRRLAELRTRGGAKLWTDCRRAKGRDCSVGLPAQHSISTP